MATQQDLTQHDNPGVRWQAQMEEHLSVARERLHVVGRMSVSPGAGTTVERATENVEIIKAHAAVAHAAATAALALAVANVGGDIEQQFSHLTAAIVESA